MRGVATQLCPTQALFLKLMLMPSLARYKAGEVMVVTSTRPDTKAVWSSLIGPGSSRLSSDWLISVVYFSALLCHK